MGAEIYGREMGLPIRDRQALGCGYVVIIDEMFSSVPSEPTEPLSAATKSGEFLATLSGLSTSEFERRADRANLVPPPYSLESIEYNRQRAAAFIQMLQHRRVILLGRNVSSAFGIFSRWFTETRCYNGEYYVMPHPNSMKRWWGDPRNKVMAQEFLSWALSGR